MLNEKIKDLRNSLGISQVELAKELKVTKQSVSNWENNNIMPSIEMLVRLSEYFSVSSDYLLGLDERKYIEISGLTDKQLRHIQLVILDIVS